MSEPTSRRPAYARLLDRAVRILAVRDHSEQELRRKLSAPVMGKNGPEEIDATADDYERVIAWCHEHHYLDDERFVTRFIASRSRKGYGPARIRQELNQKGISRESTEKAMRECEIDWSEMAREQAVRKYGEPLLQPFQKRLRYSAFALSRVSDGRYPANMAKFCRLSAYGILLPGKENLSYSHFFRLDAGCLTANSVCDEYSLNTQNHSSRIKAASEPRERMTGELAANAEAA